MEWRRATADDVPAIQALLATDPAYFDRVEGAPLRSDEAVHLFADRPPGFPLERKLCFLVGDVALLDLLDGYPDDRTWYLGQIFIAPAARGAGLGTRLIEELCARVRIAGGAALRLAVVAVNTDARRLYDRLGFAHVARRQRTTWNGVVQDVDVLERSLLP
jgi:ribosomal protein S18 acetylase RimI-like enzyme